MIVYIHSNFPQLFRVWPDCKFEFDYIYVMVCFYFLRRDLLQVKINLWDDKMMFLLQPACSSVPQHFARLGFNTCTMDNTPTFPHRWAKITRIENDLVFSYSKRRQQPVPVRVTNSSQREQLWMSAVSLILEDVPTHHQRCNTPKIASFTWQPASASPPRQSCIIDEGDGGHRALCLTQSLCRENNADWTQMQIVLSTLWLTWALCLLLCLFLCVFISSPTCVSLPAHSLSGEEGQTPLSYCSCWLGVSFSVSFYL